MSRKKDLSRASIRSILCTPSERPFDTWNSATTGHQRSEHSSATARSWMQSRNQKLMWQFGSAGGDSKSVQGRSAPGGMPSKGARSTTDIRSFYAVAKAPGDEAKFQKLQAEKDFSSDIIASSSVVYRHPCRGHDSSPARPEKIIIGSTEHNLATRLPAHSLESPPLNSNARTLPKQIFSQITVYINGLTAPMISDHKLRHLLASHGASLSLSLTRRKVTHVIIGRPNEAGHGAGGGLSGTKFDKEIRRASSSGVKYVSPEWVIESIRAGRCLPESRFARLHIASATQRSVRDLTLSVELFETKRKLLPNGDIPV